MRDGFVSGSLSIALSALIAAILFLSLPSDADRDELSRKPDGATIVNPSDAPIAGEQKVSEATGVESVTLPPPPVLHQPDQASPPLTNVENPSDEAKTILVVEPLQPTAPEAQQSPPEAIEPLRPSSPADMMPGNVEAEPHQPSAMDEFKTSADIVPDAELSPEPAPYSEGTSGSRAASPPDAAIVAEGRVLLRILEHGSGPSIEIAWPVERGKRRQLYRRFGTCFGMKIALMDEDGNLFIAKGIRGQSWDLDLDRHSGFVRQTTGQITASEERQVRSIRAFHGGLGRTASVRVFPRRMDAILLGGLRQLIGSGYGKLGSIRATYRIDGGQVLVEAIKVDGEFIHGHVDLSGAANASCRYQGVT